MSEVGIHALLHTQTLKEVERWTVSSVTESHPRWWFEGSSVLSVSQSLFHFLLSISLFVNPVSLYISHSTWLSLSPPLALSLSLSLSLFSYWSISLPFWSFLMPGLPWNVFLYSWPAGMRGSYQTSQMVELFLVLKSWTWNDTLAKLMTVTADIILVGNKFTTLPTASQKLK